MIYISRIKYQKKELHSINKPLNSLLFSPNQFICNNYNIKKLTVVIRIINVLLMLPQGLKMLV